LNEETTDFLYMCYFSFIVFYGTTASIHHLVQKNPRPLENSRKAPAF